MILFTKKVFVYLDFFLSSHKSDGFQIVWKCSLTFSWFFFFANVLSLGVLLIHTEMIQNSKLPNHLLSIEVLTFTDDQLIKYN